MAIIVLIILVLMVGVSFFFIYGANKQVKQKEVFSDESLNKEMRKKAAFCVESAASAFDKTLDYSESSIRILDQMIQDGWKNKSISDVSKNKIIGIFSSYFGQTFINNYGGTWFQKSADFYPVVLHADADFEFSPFAIIKDKFAKMNLFDLTLAYQEVKDEYFKKIDAEK